MTHRIGIGLVLCVYLLLGVLSMNDMLIYTPDSARYLAWAESLAHFDGFRDGTTPEPTRYVVHAPLYPILIAPAALVAPGSVVAAKMTTLLFGALLIGLTWFWLRRVAGEAAGLLGAGVLALHPLMLIYSTQVLSDVPFAVCVVLFLILMERLEQKPEPGPSLEIGLLIVIIAGIFLREVGLTLMLAGTGYAFLRRQYQRGARILLVSVLFYLLWYVRNEVIVAGIENPPMRNTRVFLTHYYTAANTSLIVELGTRFWSNLVIYARLFPRLLLYPDLGTRTISVVTVADPLVRFVTGIMPIGQYLLGGTSLLLACVGGWDVSRRWSASPVAGVFLLFYMGPILFYPINDVRFLFPILLLLLFLASIGLLRVAERIPARWRTLVLAVAGVLLLAPNLLWVQSFVRNSSSYRSSPEAFAASIITQRQYPELFSKPLSAAGTWITEHSDPSAVILTRWKELALWTQGRKVIASDPETTPDQFDACLDSYDIGYLVTVVSRGGLREHEVLCVQSPRFAFETVYRVANVEVLRVHRRTAGTADAFRTPADSVRAPFALALRMLDAGRPAEAESLLVHLGGRIGRYGAIIFHIGVAKEFAGHLDEAADEFARFRSVPQAGSYIQQAWYHQEMIARLKSALATADPEQRADRLHVVGINYWELGFRGEALRMLDKAIAVDSAFYPAVIFSAIFRYRTGDIVSARRYQRLASAIASANPLSASLGEVLSLSEALEKEPNSSHALILRLGRADALAGMGMRDDAAEDLRIVLAASPENRPAMHQLASIEEMKGHDAPAMALLERMERLKALNPGEADRLAELRERWR